MCSVRGTRPRACLMLARFQQQLFYFPNIALVHMRYADHALESPRCFRVAHRCAGALPGTRHTPKQLLSVRFVSQDFSDFPQRAILGASFLGISESIFLLGVNSGQPVQEGVLLTLPGRRQFKPRRKTSNQVFISNPMRRNKRRGLSADKTCNGCIA